uniref:SAM-dependent MTase RsmB/NOP-type domain-containing protein n=1 Tax=Ciona savignyi TaxID=51511 RepID=H2Z201_CIOSA
QNMALYKSAEEVLTQVTTYKSSVKKSLFASKFKNPKQLAALVMETLKYKVILEEILEQTKLLKQSKGVSHNLALFLLYDFLIGKGIQCGGKLKKFVSSRKSMLNSAFARMKIRKKVAKNEDLIETKHPLLPKYLRVNTLTTTFKKMVVALEKDGYSQVDINENEIELKQFSVDPDISNLLVFNPKTDLHAHQLYKNGSLIFQDKASCLSAFVLDPAPHTHVIDACAAPGNKTSHLAAIMNNTGKLFAVDRDRDRVKIMERQLQKANVQNCEIINSDFMKLNPTDPKFQKVECILVDPSCSGSGIVSRDLENQKDTNAERVVYSTCSIHQEENEDVVKSALKQNPFFKLLEVMPAWTNRGIKMVNYETQKCIRCDPAVNCTNGFFVALFLHNTVSQ